ncbi:MAG: NUDIX hydrolase [Chloroflexi bacterium]|nr:NUDIX hydrolase [Chloroflexota bacterium]MYB22452.1 NUDIX hydrolase [Chloroflexota bacterium]MYD16612.1 NUDIX hydrolase [Chloroflexota bacterium]MYF21853.1 NUDIX hydrolase [Chloroflexota bacterium]MYF80752.1 NUDIX hydrolase [Chloroflexota bacterium]
MPPPPRFCPQCAEPLASVTGCKRCGWIHYFDPKVAVVVLATDEHGRLLYVRRNHEPAMYEWAWPSGFVDAGERVEDAAVREVREETGVEVEVEELLGVWSATGEQVVLIAYRARAVAGALRPGSEALAAAWHPLQPESRRPRTVFPHDAAVLRSFLGPER